MSPKERRAFAFGYRFAFRKARKDLHRLAADFDSQIANLKDEARKELHSQAASFGAEIGNAIARQAAVREAANERSLIPDGWLN